MTDTPTNVTSVRTGNYTVKLSWSTPASNTPSIAGYEVFYTGSDNNITQNGGTTTTGTTTINVTLPALDVKYDLFVVAFSDAGNVLPSERSNSSTIFLTKLGKFLMKAFFIHLVFMVRWS